MGTLSSRQRISKSNYDFLNNLNRTSIDIHQTKLKELFHSYDDCNAQERIYSKLKQCLN